MPKRVIRPKRPKDINEWAHQMVDESTKDETPSPGQTPVPDQDQTQAPPPATPAQISVFMAGIGQKGGRIGGKRRLKTMTAKQRKASAKKAAQARWAARPSDQEVE